MVSAYREASSITLNILKLPEKTLRFLPPLVLYPKKDSGGYLVVEDEDYELCVFAKDIKALEKELTSEFALMWKVYVSDEGREMTARAEKLRQTLLNNIREESVACATE